MTLHAVLSALGGGEGPVGVHLCGDELLLTVLSRGFPSIAGLYECAWRRLTVRSFPYACMGCASVDASAVKTMAAVTHSGAAPDEGAAAAGTTRSAASCATQTTQTQTAAWQVRRHGGSQCHSSRRPSLCFSVPSVSVSLSLPRSLSLSSLSSLSLSLSLSLLRSLSLSLSS